MCICNNCNKEFNTLDVNVLGLCNDCFFESNFKEPSKIRQLLADNLEEEGEMLLADEDKHLQKIGEKLKMYAIVVEKL